MSKITTPASASAHPAPTTEPVGGTCPADEGRRCLCDHCVERYLELQEERYLASHNHPALVAAVLANIKTKDLTHVVQEALKDHPDADAWLEAAMNVQMVCGYAEGGLDSECAGTASCWRANRASDKLLEDLDEGHLPELPEPSHPDNPPAVEALAWAVADLREAAQRLVEQHICDERRGWCCSCADARHLVLALRLPLRALCDTLQGEAATLAD